MLLPFAPLSFVPGIRSAVIRTAQVLINADECLIHLDLAQWHHYEFQWLPERVVFSVDGSVILRTEVSPLGPLGFVTWIDNQYMIFSPSKGLKFGVLATTAKQWLELSDLDIREF
jgi:hypothetical protein